MRGRHEPSHPTRVFYDRISHVYDLIADVAEHHARERGQERLALARGESVVEIGFGPGRALVDFARRVGRDGRVVGVDLSGGMLRQALKRLEAEGVADRVEATVGDARELPCKDATFDAAFASFTLELFSDADIPAVLSELHRVLHPGGRLVIVHMASTSVSGRMERVYEWMHRHFPHFVDCRPIRPEVDVRAAGFRDVETEATTVCGLPVGILHATSDSASRD